MQAQVVNLFQELQEEFNLTYLFISHGLAVVEHISTRVAVMYLGRIVEIAEAAELYARPLHPYTQALLSAIPIPDPRQKRKRIILQGDVRRRSIRRRVAAFALVVRWRLKSVRMSIRSCAKWRRVITSRAYACRDGPTLGRDSETLILLGVSARINT